MGPELNTTGTPVGGGRFLLSVNGDPVGWADPHGAWLDWVANPPASYSGGDRTRCDLRF